MGHRNKKPRSNKDKMSEFTEKSLIKYNLLHNGDVAQLGECRVRNAKVGSSILLVSTTISRPDMLWPVAYYFSAGQPVIPPRNRQVRHTIRPSCRAHCTRGLICQRQAGIQDVFRHIAGDPARNFAIATKIENAYKQGRKVLVLTERTSISIPWWRL